MGEPEDSPDANSKLVARKQEWARDGRLLTPEALAARDRGETVKPAENRLPDRLPPGQTLVKDWPVLDLGAQPEVTAERFRLAIDGAVRRPIGLTLDELLALPQTESVSDMHCVTQWSRYDNAWQGVAARVLLDMVEPLGSAKHLIFHAYDGYTTNVRLEQFDQPDVFLVHRWEGKPIDRRHGGPVRVLIPRLYLWKSAKWIRRIEFSALDKPGFWEVRGYNNNADPWLEERYS